MKINLDIHDSFITPMNLLKITKRVYELNKGDELEVVTNDKITVDQLRKILDLSKLYVETNFNGKTNSFHIRIKKKIGGVTMADLNNIQAQATVDARGSACPGPLLEAKKGYWKGKGWRDIGNIFQ